MKPPKQEEEEEQEDLTAGRINIDDFDKVEIKAGTIINAEGVKKADKLLKIQVDLGEEKRQIVSGIREQYEPEDIIGKRCSPSLTLNRLNFAVSCLKV